MRSADRRSSASKTAVNSDSARAAEKRRGLRADLGLIAASALYLYFNLFTFRGISYRLGGDQIFFWMDAQRLLLGDKVYADFFQFTPPGTDLVYAAAFRLLGERMWVTNLITGALGVALCWVCYRIAARFLGRTAALLAASVVLVVLYGKLLNGTHHWFSELAVLCAALVLMPKRTVPRIAAAGVLLGLATFFTQTRGPAVAVGIVAFLAWEARQERTSAAAFFKKTVWLGGAMMASWLVLSAYFIATIGITQILRWQIGYAAGHEVSWTRGLPVPSQMTLKSALGFLQFPSVAVLLPIIYALSLWMLRAERGAASSELSRRRALLTAVGLATAVEVAMSPNWLRIYCIAAPGIILLIWRLAQSGAARRYLFASMWIVLLLLAAKQIADRQREQQVVMQLPTGTVATDAIWAAKFEWIGQHTHPGDSFFQVAWPGVYFPLQLRNPVFAEALTPGNETRPEFVAGAIRQLDEKQVRYLLWMPRPDLPAGSQPQTDNLGPFRAYMNEKYRRVWVFPDQDEIWERQ